MLAKMCITGKVAPEKKCLLREICSEMQTNFHENFKKPHKKHQIHPPLPP